MTRRRYVPQEGVTMYQGVQLPYTVMWIKGKPDPKMVDPVKVRKCLALGLCGVCGLRLDRREGVAFIAGSAGMIEREGRIAQYGDPPNHPDCAEQAMEECPFLVNKRQRPRNRDQTVDDALALPDSGDYGIARARWYDWNIDSLKSWPLDGDRQRRGND